MSRKDCAVMNRAHKCRRRTEYVVQGGVKTSSSAIYDKKWGQFKSFCMDENIQDVNETINTEKCCDPGEVINIRSALANIYKRKFNRVEEWFVENGVTRGSPVNEIVIQEIIKSYQRQKKSKGFKRALPLQYSYMRKV